jgi:hypothetical protein
MMVPIMKWKTKPKPEPKHGDTRKRTIFAISPVVTKWEETEYTVWLETYGVDEMYFEYPNHPNLNHWGIVDRFPLFYEGEKP